MPLNEDFSEHVHEDTDPSMEEQVTHALRRATQDFPPHSTDLVRRSVARGRRMRLLGAARTAVAAAAVVAVGGTLMATDAFGIRSGSGYGTPDRSVPGAHAGSTGQSPAPLSSSVSGDEMVRTLKSLLPPGGTVSAASGRGSAEDPVVWPSAKLTYTTPHGSSGIDIDIARLASGVDAGSGQEGRGGCLPVEVRPYDTCTTERLPGGAVLNTTKSYTYPSSDTGQKRWYVVLTTADGAQLTAEEFGGGGEKGSSSGVDPVLSIAQLTSIVRSPAWNRVIAAVPAPGEAPATTASTGEKGVPGARMSQVLRSHLPDGAVSDVNAGDGLVQLVHDDGRGKNMVEVDAQYDRTALLAGHMGCADESGTCEATTLADGTRVKKVKGRSEKGGSAVVWLVDTLRPDGRRVAVREVNSYAESGPVTRPRPTLSMDELLNIALDKRFLTGKNA